VKLAYVVFGEPVTRPGTQQNLASIAKTDDGNELSFEQGLVTWTTAKGVMLIPAANVRYMEPAPAPKK